ncbi:MAG TPA: hypothetical protein DHW07_07090, partial [Gammaproteobacteria bacterium]|nr:hypothetical protein [Gammaproteobacteria bacterium]
RRFAQQNRIRTGEHQMMAVSIKTATIPICKGNGAEILIRVKDCSLNSLEGLDKFCPVELPECA